MVKISEVFAVNVWEVERKMENVKGDDIFVNIEERLLWKQRMRSATDSRGVCDGRWHYERVEKRLINSRLNNGLEKVAGIWGD